MVLLCISIIFNMFCLAACSSFTTLSDLGSNATSVLKCIEYHMNIILTSYEYHMNIIWNMKNIWVWFPGSWLAQIAVQVLPPLGKETPIDGTTQDPFQGPAHTPCFGCEFVWSRAVRAGCSEMWKRSCSRQSWFVSIMVFAIICLYNAFRQSIGSKVARLSGFWAFLFVGLELTTHLHQWTVSRWAFESLPKPRFFCNTSLRFINFLSTRCRPPCRAQHTANARAARLKRTLCTTLHSAAQRSIPQHSALRHNTILHSST